MRKLLLIAAGISAIFFAQAQQPRKLDQPMVAKKCSIRVEANAFVAKTFIELEYYNNQDVEIEGVEYFSLAPGQVISAFQLELNGQYRDGSIEEKWKASNAYNSIVGKRVDPALLQMTYPDNYRLNIYPFAPRSSRKVTFTIVQLMKYNKDCLEYELPVNFFSSVDELFTDIHISGGYHQPIIDRGLLTGSSFSGGYNNFYQKRSFEKLYGNTSLNFCLKQYAGQYHYLQSGEKFAVKMLNDVPKNYLVKNEKITILWDNSLSAKTRNIEKELHFLQTYIVLNRIREVELFSFNNSVKHLGKFYTGSGEFSYLKTAITNIEYGGSTNFGGLASTDLLNEVCFIFSDGITTTGTNKPLALKAQVNFVVSSMNYNYNFIRQVTEWGGGSFINLATTRVEEVMALSVKRENMLYEITSEHKKFQLDQSLPVKSDDILITGINKGKLTLKFGNHLYEARKYDLSPNEKEDTSLKTFEIIKMITGYEKLRRTGRWQDLLVFGLENRIVTANTAYIVLERIEDYIRYNIAPPKELEQQCREMNYVYNSGYRKSQILESEVNELLVTQINEANNKFKWWNVGNSYKANPEPSEQKDKNIVALTEVATNISSPQKPVTVNVNEAGANTMAEVVVTGAFNTKKSMRSAVANVQNISSDQFNTIRQQNVNDALAGKVAGLQVRSQSAAKLGAATEIRLRGMNGIGTNSAPIFVVNGTLMPDAQDTNPDDVEDITVLQGPSAAALFGSEGANGAIVINLKKGRRYEYYNYNYDNPRYKLSKQPDIDYIAELKAAGKSAFIKKYAELKKEYAADVSFYLDVAELFYENNLKPEAMLIMDEAIEMSYNNEAYLRAAAYIFESWGEFNRAVELYNNNIEVKGANVSMLRDLALCYFQGRQYQQALDTYYSALKMEADDYYSVKNLILNEMNALIAVHKDSLDISRISPEIIKPYPADMLISLSANSPMPFSFEIIGPAGNHIKYFGYYGLVSNENLYTSDQNELLIRRAESGKHRISVQAYDNYYMPALKYYRIVCFKNFQRKNQSLEIKYVQMDGQSGKVEIGSVKW